MNTAALLEYTMEETTLQNNRETAEEPAQSPPVERVTEKIKDPKKWQPGVPALPPERQSKKNDFSNSFGEPRNHFVPPSPPPPGTPANIPPKEEQAVSWPERRDGLTNWTPWIVGACLTGGVLMFHPRLRATQTRSPAGPVDCAQAACG